MNKIKITINNFFFSKFKSIKLYSKKKYFFTNVKKSFYVIEIIRLPIYNIEKKKIGVINSINNFKAGNIIEIKFYNDKMKTFPLNNFFFPIIKKKYLMLYNKYN
jgi:ribosomal 30S subunit maturation factor RimM